LTTRERVFERRGWISAAILLPAIVLASFSRPWTSEGGWADTGADFLAWLVLGGGIFLRLWATLYIGGRKSTSLVTGGPYAMCRHPLYVASFLIVVSLAFYLQSLTILAGAVVVGIVYAAIIVPSEERHAAACFGDAYREYGRSTPRFLPRFRSLERPGTVEIKMAAFLREFARVYGLIALGAAADLLAYCRGQPWWPAIFRLP